MYSQTWAAGLCFSFNSCFPDSYCPSSINCQHTSWVASCCVGRPHHARCVLPTVMIGNPLHCHVPLMQSHLLTCWSLQEDDKHPHEHHHHDHHCDSTCTSDHHHHDHKCDESCTHEGDHHSHLDHKHDSSVTSVGIVSDGSADMRKLNQWLSTLLQERGPDLFRSKGILSIAGSPHK